MASKQQLTGGPAAKEGAKDSAAAAPPGKGGTVAALGFLATLLWSCACEHGQLN